MTQSAFDGQRTLHVAIIMDGNGRWAIERGLPRLAGHRRGADAVRSAVKAAPGLGIATLTLFAFSSDNWKRPPEEVGALMRLFRQYLQAEVPRLVDNGVRLSIIGRRDRLDAPLVLAIEAAEAATKGGLLQDSPESFAIARSRQLHLRVAIDYSARDAILRAAARFDAADAASRETFAVRLGEACGGGDAPDVDLFIRTGGERRLSDFLLWESAYAELYFTSRMWPEFDGRDLAAAVADFHLRQRRFGGLTVGRYPTGPVAPVAQA